MTAERELAALVVFGLVYVVLGYGSLPPLRIDRAGAALVGATAMIAFGVLTPREAVSALDFHTLALLLGMMIVVAHLRLAGFFSWLDAHALRGARDPRRLLRVTLWLSGGVAALFVNDTACILLTPLVLEMTEGMGLPPIPFLIAVAMGANLGSVATLIGNPQNMLVASFSGIGYTRFAELMVPVALAGLALASALLPWMFRRELTAPTRAPAPAPASMALDRPLFRKSLIIAGLLLAALFAGAPPSLAVLGAAAAMLITRRVDPGEIYSRVDWSLLLMFAGLFVVVAGVEHTEAMRQVLLQLDPHAQGTTAWFVAAIVALSNLVSNVPAVLLLKDWGARVLPHEYGWMLLAMTSTLAGNLTLVGSVANLIVVEQARGRARIGFMAYARAGVPVTLATLGIGLGWLSFAARR